MVSKSHEEIAKFMQNATAPNCIDATCGNGGDTLFLARLASPNGKIFAFDIQADAINATRKLLRENSLEDAAQFFNAPHELAGSHIPQDFFAAIDVAMFNLGWLPGSDKSVITKPESTTRAISSIIKMMRPQKNLISILAYRGHNGGNEEFDAVKKLIAPYRPQTYGDESNASSPILFIFSV